MRRHATEILGMQTPIVQAPMAGGHTNVQMSVACAKAGALPCIAGAYITAEDIKKYAAAVRQEVKESPPLCINLFVPPPIPSEPVAEEKIRLALRHARALKKALQESTRQAQRNLPKNHRHSDIVALADRILSEELAKGEVAASTTENDGAITALLSSSFKRMHSEFGKKIDTVLDVSPSSVSFTFGIPPSTTIGAVKEKGIRVLATVTTVDEATQAVAAGADALIVQGNEAGGHRGSYSGLEDTPWLPVAELVRLIRKSIGGSGDDDSRIPVVASGGISAKEDIAQCTAAGADAFQIGSALLLSKESGTPKAHQLALRHLKQEEGRQIIKTKGFSGRSAQGLENVVTRHYAKFPEAILPFPMHNDLTVAFFRKEAQQIAADALTRPPADQVLLAASEFLPLWSGTKLHQGSALSVDDGASVEKLFSKL